MGTQTLTQTATTPRAGRRPRVVVVDDEPEVSEAVAELLVTLGCDAKTFCDSREAVNYLCSEPIDGLVVDMRMPETDGTQVVSAIRKSAINGKVLVAVMTGFSDAPAMEASFSAGASIFISKPVNETSMRKLVNLLRAFVLKDTRGSRRQPLNVPVSCTHGSRIVGASCVNLSEGGMLLEGLKDTQIGDQVQLEFSVPGNSRALKLAGKIIRKDSQKRTAIAFSSVPVSQREIIRNFLHGAARN